MSFEIAGKIALVSGGASGIGLCYAKELLRNGLKGVVLADIDDTLGKRALEEIEKEFQSNKAIFVQTDVTDKESYENAFKKTIEHFKNLDILINNAGVFDEISWEKVINVNVIGVVNGMVLGLEKYISKYKSSSDGVIINTSSIAGVLAIAAFPIYSASKHAVTCLGVAYGAKVHYDRTKVKVLTLCPGFTDTALFKNSRQKMLEPFYEVLLKMPLTSRQTPESVATALTEIIKHAESGTVWISNEGKKPFKYLAAPQLCIDKFINLSGETEFNTYLRF